MECWEIDRAGLEAVGDRMAAVKTSIPDVQPVATQSTDFAVPASMKAS
jgi:hypothetical protein